MKLSELKEIVDRAVERGKRGLGYADGDLTVVVHTAQGGIPTNIKAGVKHAGPGFDWEASMFNITTEEPVIIIKKLQKSYTEYAEQTLKALKEAHEKLKFKYIPKAHEDSWIEGFKAGLSAFKDCIGSEDQEKRYNEMRSALAQIYLLTKDKESVFNAPGISMLALKALGSEQ